MWLTNLAIRRPIVILMIFAALTVMGLRSRSFMPVDLYPKVDIPYMFVLTMYPGAGPEEVETLVSKPIEDALSGVNGMKNIMSSSQEGVSAVTLEMEIGTNIDDAAADVRSKIDAVRMLLPSDAESPVVQKIDIGSIPVLWLGISSSRPVSELRELADDVIKDRLAKLDGVAAVTVTGGQEREIQVNVDRSRLEAYGLSISQVVQTLTMANLNLPSGRVTEGAREYAVRAVGEFRSLDDIRNLQMLLPSPDGVKVVTIADIAEVKETVADREEATRLQRKDSIGLLVQKQSGANTVDVADAVKAELESMRSVLPKDVEIAISLDLSDRVREALHDVNVALWLGAFLAVFIVFLFLHNIRGTFIVAIAIPASIVATFIPVYFAGFSLNMMVMMGLSLAVGILVDDSIVVLENIYRHLAKGESPREAAFNGRTEIGLAAITITMVDVVVFVPIAFMGGMVGQFFREFGITVASATLFSLFVSFTLTPMLASRWYRKGDALEASTGFFARFDRFYHSLDTGYRKVLQWALARRGKVIAAGFATLVIIVVITMPLLGFEFFPRVDQGFVMVNIEMPVGTSLEATDSVVMQVEEILAGIPEVEYIFTNLGSTRAGVMGAGTKGANYAQISASLSEKESVLDRLLRPFMRGEPKRRRSDQEIAQDIRSKTARIAGGRITASIESGMGGGGSPIDLELTGSDMEELNKVAERVRDVLEATEGVINVDISWKVGKPEIKAEIDRIKAAKMGLSQAVIASSLRTSIEGSTDTQFRRNGKEYDVRVRLDEMDRYSAADVGRVVVGSSGGRPIFLQDVASISEGTGPTKIERKNRQRKISVTADLEKGYRVGNVYSGLQEKLKEIDYGTVQLFAAGEVESMGREGRHLFGALLLSIALVYMLMAALFESLFNPFIIMFSLPMALIGALLALALSGESLSIVSMIGIIMLMGLVTKNAILLVDYTNTLRSRGMERDAAILEAGPTRLRPILMTTLAMIGGMLPTALKLGRGSELRAPMAIAVIGGLIVSSVLTLVVIPSLYSVFDDWMEKYQQRKRRLLGANDDREKPDSAPVPDDTASDEALE